MGSDTVILVVEAVVGLSVMVLLAAAAGRDRRPEDACDQCGTRTITGQRRCRTCGAPIRTPRETGEQLH